MPNHPQTVNLGEFQGIDNVLQPERTPENYLKKAINIDIDKTGSVHKRSGYVSVFSGSGCHSLWSNDKDAYIVDNTILKYVYSNFATTNIETECFDRIDYVEVNNEVYFTSQSKTGVLSGSAYRAFGIEPPVALPMLAASSPGFLDAGQYQVAYTYVDAEGRESGASKASVIRVTSDNSSILVTNLDASSDSDVTKIRIYLSNRNGSGLYHLTDIADTVSSYVITDTRNLHTPLDSFNVSGCPTGDLIAYYNGRIYVADGDTLYASEPHSYTWFRTERDYIRFESNITVVMPVETGIYVGTENHLHYLGGSDLVSFNQDMKEICQPVKYSHIKIPSGYIRIENTPGGPKWLFTANEGIFVCMNNGVVFNVTSEHVAFPNGLQGAAGFIQKDGINKYVSLIKDADNSDNEKGSFSDLVTADVIRNGVIIT